MSREQLRLDETGKRRAHWRRWGPYLSERAWGTVREDYSPDGTAWEYFSHEHSRSRTYRWNEDGLAGVSDRHQRICLAVALWNERDPILKERLFGLTGPEGNHGEDVKEYYAYVDSTPTHSYMRYLYRYPHGAYPYAELVARNQGRSKRLGEYELLDTGIFDEDRYFDVVVEYAKATPDDVLMRITVTNHGAEPATLRVLPTLWFRNTWSWGHENIVRPSLRRAAVERGAVELDEPMYGRRWWLADGSPDLLFTENETNVSRIYGRSNDGQHAKDGINDYVVDGIRSAVNPAEVGTKVAAHYRYTIGPGASSVMRLRLTDGLPVDVAVSRVGGDFDEVFAARIREADEFYATVIPADLSVDGASVMRQSIAGLLWSKQFYHYVVKDWLDGDAEHRVTEQRRRGRNHQWTEVYNADVISMPDKWEYPWFAAWDLAFHCVPIALVDPEFAKDQLVLLLREWYMHPNGQLPAYEWEFGDVNPPVHAWAVWRVYKIDKKRHGRGDLVFLERVFHKLLLNFTWWINRKDADGLNIFQGGFLGLDNIGVFDRSRPLPTGGHLEQSDGTSWMAMYTLNLLAIAMELARTNPAYEDVASKFWEHFLHIAHAMNNRGIRGLEQWDDEDGFYYDVLLLPDGSRRPLRVRSMVGLIPLFAVETLEPELLDRLPGFKRRLEWFIEHRPDLTRDVASMGTRGEGQRRLLSVVPRERLRRVLHVLLDEREFLSPYGIRALSVFHRAHPYQLDVDGMEHRVDYEPAESTSGMFGGNANWRGPVWFPVNYLIVESLQKFHHYLGDDFKVECPTGSDRMLTLAEVATEISQRLARIFLLDERGRRPVWGNSKKFQEDARWRDLIFFYEYFHGDTGEGLGANHQTGWTGLVAKLLQQSGDGSSPYPDPAAIGRDEQLLDDEE